MTGAIVPQGDYQKARVAGGLVFTAGMTPRIDGRLVVTGSVGSDVPLADARDCAALAASNALRAAREVLADLTTDSVVLDLDGVVSMTVFIAADRTFTDLGAVADGASAAVRSAFPGGLLPARAAVGVASLPGGAPVEVQLIGLIRTSSS